MARRTNENKKYVEGNMITVDAPIIRVIVNTGKVAKFATALPTANSEKGGFAFTAVTIFKGSFNKEELDELDAMLRAVETYDKKKHKDYRTYLVDCDHVIVCGHLASNEYKGATSIEIVADSMTFEE